MEASLDAVLLTAMEGGRRAAHVCRAVLAEAPDTPDAMAKLGKEPVTVADYGSQAVILEAVARAFPNHGVISEEGSAHLREASADDGAEQIIRIASAALGRRSTSSRSAIGSTTLASREPSTPGRSTPLTAPRASCAASNTRSRLEFCETVCPGPASWSARTCPLTWSSLMVSAA